METSIAIDAKIDAKIFRDFALYDTFRVRRRWRLPALFALIMTGFAALCFSRYQTAGQAVLLGVVLLVIGIGLPLIYFISYLSSIQKQIQKLGLATPQPAYTVTLSGVEDGIAVETARGEQAVYRWDSVCGVYRGKNCTYLYVQSTRAYLLPDRDVGDRRERLENLLRSKELLPGGPVR